MNRVFFGMIHDKKKSRIKTNISHDFLSLVGMVHTRGNRIGPYEVHEARTPTIRASFLGSSGRAAMPNRDARARRQAPPQAKLRHSVTAPVGGWIRRRRRMKTEHRRAGKRRIELTLREKK